AVLDELSDPRLFVDRDPAAEWVSEPIFVGSGADFGAAAAPQQPVLRRTGSRIFVSAVHDPADLRQPVGARPDPDRGRSRSRRATAASLLWRDLAADPAGDRRRLAARADPGDRRVRHPRPAWRTRYVDDRQSAVGRILQ